MVIRYQFSRINGRKSVISQLISHYFNMLYDFHHVTQEAELCVRIAQSVTVISYWLLVLDVRHIHNDTSLVIENPNSCLFSFE